MVSTLNYSNKKIGHEAVIKSLKDMNSYLNKEIIYIKYFYYRSINYYALFLDMKDKFSNYNWGATIKTSNFRWDQKYFYIEIEYDAFFTEAPKFVQGFLAGWLEAQGVEILL